MVVALGLDVRVRQQENRQNDSNHVPAGEYQAK